MLGEEEALVRHLKIKRALQGMNRKEVTSLVANMLRVRRAKNIKGRLSILPAGSLEHLSRWDLLMCRPFFFDYHKVWTNSSVYKV